MPSIKLPQIPLRIVLVVPFVIQIIVTVGLVGYLSFRNGQQAVNDVARQLRGEINTRIAEHLDTFLDTPHQINQANAIAIGRGQIDARDQAALERHFWDQVQIYEAVTSIYFGNTVGGLADAGREGAAGSLYVIGTDGFVDGPFRKYATDSQGNRTTLLSTVPNFDARTRPWYTSAVEQGGAVWSDVYILFTGQDMAISASRPVYDDQHNLLGVTAVDLFLSHLSNFLAGLEIGHTGHSFIMERSGLLIAASTGEQPFATPTEGTAPQRIQASASTAPLIRAAAAALTKQFGAYQAITHAQQFEFTLDSQRQLAQVLPIQNQYGLDWLVVTVIPEADFMAQIEASNRTTLFLIGAALLAAVILGIFTARWITRPILRLNASAQALAHGRWQPAVAVDWISEVGQLTESFNHMSQQLRQTLESLNAEIAERRRVEVGLRDTSVRLSTLIDNLRSGVLFESQDRHILYVNRRFCDLFNIPGPPEALVGSDCVAPAQASSALFVQSQDFAAQIEAIVAGQQPVMAQELTLVDGRTFERDYVPIRVNGDLRGHLWQYRDITDRQQAQAERERLLHDLQMTLTRVKQLSGMLPICASCKKIRDDAGYWHDVAAYVRDHSEAEFTHGLCPDCAERLYPDYYSEMDEQEP
ncbi:MAG: HAMP domain-containing protein [Chloroflexi bacterium]|nr:HAMP domain-containing protein [Chloroflexota bacterium]MBU1751767.1 HAMP domain-containing protein [Chloroflexota bacterium]